MFAHNIKIISFSNDHVNICIDPKSFIKNIINPKVNKNKYNLRSKNCTFAYYRLRQSDSANEKKKNEII